MNDDQLRALVRDAVARHLGRAASPAPVFPGSDHLRTGLRGSAGASAEAEAPGTTHPWREHASHHLYLSLVNVDGACVIEPAIACDHCGYCKSHGH